MLIDRSYTVYKCYTTNRGGYIVELESTSFLSKLLSLIGVKPKREHYILPNGKNEQWVSSNGKLLIWPDQSKTVRAIWMASQSKDEIEDWEDKNLTEDEKDVKDIIT